MPLRSPGRVTRTVQCLRPARRTPAFRALETAVRKAESARKDPTGVVGFTIRRCTQRACTSSYLATVSSSVGKNAFWLLDWTPNQTGVLRPDHILRYAEFGDWITECYSAAVVESTNFTAGTGGPLTTLTVPAGHEVDRIVLRENLVDGQLIQGFTVTASSANGTFEGAHEQAVAVQGSSIGNKFIGMLDKVYSAGTTLKFQATASARGASMVSAAAYNCSRTPQASGCGYQQDFAYKVVRSITLKTVPHATNDVCCAACRADNDCAVFVISPSKTCSVLSANQGGAALKGAVSGTPKR